MADCKCSALASVIASSASLGLSPTVRQRLIGVAALHVQGEPATMGKNQATVYRHLLRTLSLDPALSPLHADALRAPEGHQGRPPRLSVVP